MPVYQLKEISTADGLSFLAAWFDDAQYLWDDERLRRSSSLVADWVAPDLSLVRPDEGITDVLFNPRAYAVSVKIRDQLAHFPELEFLPVNIRDHGIFYIPHVIANCELPAGTDVVTLESPGSNIIEIISFPPGFASPYAFFRIRQPADSAAGRKGAMVRRMYMNEVGARAFETVAGKYLKAILVGDRIE
jgi:hypothetical protein